MLTLQKLYENLYWPLFEGVYKRRSIARYFREAEKSQWRSRDQIETIQLNSLNELLSHARTNCPFYRSLLESSGIRAKPLQSLTEMAQLPILTKDIIRNNISSMIAKNHAGMLWKKTTGGSTGQTLEFFQTKLSYEWRMAMSRRGYSWAGARPGSKQAYIWGAPIGNKSLLKSIKIHVNHFLDRQKYYNCFLFDVNAMTQCVDSLNKCRPDYIIGYVNPLHNLALFFRQGHEIKFRPRAIITAAEKLHDLQRKTLCDVFGCEVFESYGSREFMLIASECEKHNGLHVSAENLFVEIVDDKGLPVKDGETGRILVTDLHNYGMPFIRYDTGDLGIPHAQSCSCGRGLPLIEKIVGRSLDMLITADGKQIPGEVFVYLLLEFCDIKQFQVIQDKLDHIFFNFVPNRDLRHDTIERLRQKIQTVFGPTVTIDMVSVDEIPLTPSGKYRVTISKLQQ